MVKNTLHGKKRTSPAVPAIILLFFVMGISGWIYFAIPHIDKIEPMATQSGSAVRIRGRNFGEKRGNSRVIADGVVPTRSAYRSWSPTEIELIIPSTVDSGLVHVYTPYGVSNPAIYLESDLLPVKPAKR